MSLSICEEEGGRGVGEREREERSSSMADAVSCASRATKLAKDSSSLGYGETESLWVEGGREERRRGPKELTGPACWRAHKTLAHERVCSTFGLTNRGGGGRVGSLHELLILRFVREQLLVCMQ